MILLGAVETDDISRSLPGYGSSRFEIAIVGLVVEELCSTEQRLRGLSGEAIVRFHSTAHEAVGSLSLELRVDAGLPGEKPVLTVEEEVEVEAQIVLAPASPGYPAPIPVAKLVAIEPLSYFAHESLLDQELHHEL